MLPFVVWELAALSLSLRPGLVTHLFQGVSGKRAMTAVRPQLLPGGCHRRAAWESPEFPETLVGGLWPQNNFHHTTKTLFPLFMDLQQHSPPAAEPETLHRLNAEAAKRICLPSRAKQWFPSFALYCNHPGTLKKYRRPILTAFWFSWYMVACGALGFLKVPLECAVKLNGDLFYNGDEVTQDE